MNAQELAARTALLGFIEVGNHSNIATLFLRTAHIVSVRIVTEDMEKTQYVPAGVKAGGSIIETVGKTHMLPIGYTDVLQLIAASEAKANPTNIPAMLTHQPVPVKVAIAYTTGSDLSTEDAAKAFSEAGEACSPHPQAVYRRAAEILAIEVMRLRAFEKPTREKARGRKT